MKNLSFYAEIKDLCYIRRQKPEAITRQEYVNGEECVVIFDDVEKGFYKLKGNAGKIWDMLDGKTPLHMIVEQLQQDGSEKKDIVIEDVCTFIYKIGKKGLIKAALKKVPTSGVTP